MKRKVWNFADESLLKEKLAIVRARLETRGQNLHALLVICYDELKWTGEKRRVIRHDSQLPWHTPTPRTPGATPVPKVSRPRLLAVVIGNLNATDKLKIALLSDNSTEVDAFAMDEVKRITDGVHVFELRESFKLVPTIQRTMAQ